MLKLVFLDLVVLVFATAFCEGLNNSLSSPSPFSALGCPSAIPADGNWIFETVPGQLPSCSMPIRGDAAKVCVDANGTPDYTSMLVDMAALQTRTGCFAWKASQCAMNLRRVASIEFDIDLHNCHDLWAAPLWLSPDPWIWPADYSGEIDFAEFCPVGKVATNFGGPGGNGENEMSWASGSGLGGPKHFVMSLPDSNLVGSSGDLTTQICNLDGSNCSPGGYYKSFLDSVVSAANKSTTSPYHFMTDVWNGYSGDGGWTGCKAQNMPNTTCQFAVRNIRVTTNDGTPMFSGSKCTSLNADANRSVKGLPKLPSSQRITSVLV